MEDVLKDTGQHSSRDKNTGISKHMLYFLKNIHYLSDINEKKCSCLSKSDHHQIVPHYV